MIGHPVEIEVVRRDRGVGHPLDLGGQVLRQRGVLRPLGRRVLHEFAGPVRGGHHVAADRLGQRLEQRGDQLVAQPGHLPVESVRLHPGEQGERDLHGDAVVLGARLEPVARAEALVALLPRGGKSSSTRSSTGPSWRSSTRSAVVMVSRSGVSARACLPPALEAALIRHVRRDAALVELEHRLVVDEDVAAARALLDLVELAGAARGCARSNAVRRLSSRPMSQSPSTSAWRRNSSRASAGRCGRAARAGSGRSARRTASPSRRRRPTPWLLLPVRLAVAALGEVAGERLGPGRVDRGDRAGEQAAGLDQLGAITAAGCFLRSAEPGKIANRDLPGAEVVAALLPALRLRSPSAADVVDPDAARAARRGATGGCRRGVEPPPAGRRRSARAAWPAASSCR